MAHHFVYIEKDATIGRGAKVTGTGSLKNTVKDEILEIGKTIKKGTTSFGSINRALIKFDVTKVSQSVASGDITNAKYYLVMYDAGAVELDATAQLYSFAVSQSWEEGDGKKSDDPSTVNGVSWKLRNDHSSSLWGANQDLDWGGTYYSGSGYAASQSFNRDSSIDMRMDVTSIVNNWINGSVPNEGFIVKRHNLEETSTSASGMFKFFSGDTHTVFQPRLEVEWDDSSWSTGSLSALTSDNLDKLHLYTEGMSVEYKIGALSRVRVKGREKYPAQTFSTTSAYLDVKYLPSGSSMYSIVDTKTETTIVPFGSGSKLSCDSSGNFFRLRTSGLEPERYYKIIYKIESGSGINKTVNFYDPDHTFKVIR